MLPHILHLYGPLWIQGYGVMIVLGFLLFLLLAYRDAKRIKIIDSDTFFNTIFAGLVGAMVGGRLLFMITEWESFSNPWLEVFYVWDGGFVVLGSIIGVITVVPIYLKSHKILVLEFLDLISLYAPVMQAISRLGCLLAGCCYGRPVEDFLFSITFKNPAGLAPLNVALHPAQIYMSLLSFFIFLILLLLKKFLQKPGQIFCLYLILESAARVGIDFLRGDRGELVNLSCLHLNFSLSLMQLWSSAFLVISICALIFVSTKRRIF
jgi:phosphatidylglycerol:prolipoprotein diacylglycerol transferase